MRANLKAPQFLKIDRYAQRLSHSVCMGDGGSGWWAPFCWGCTNCDRNVQSSPGKARRHANELFLAIQNAVYKLTLKYTMWMCIYIPHMICWPHISHHERSPFEWNFRWFFLDKWNCTFFPLRKRNRLNCIIWSEFSDASEPGVWVHIMSTRNMAAELPLVLDVLSDDLEIVFFFLEKALISSFKLLQHPHFVRETSNQHPHFSHDVAQAEARWNVKENHKYRPQNVIRFHLQGCRCVLKCPPTLPTNKDSHCNN